MLEYRDFYDIAVYGNKNWGGGFDEKSIACMAYDYAVEYEFSIKRKEATRTMVELYKLLLEDCEGDPDNEELEYWVDELDNSLPGEFMWFWCGHCKKREIHYFSPTELESLDKHSARKMLIQDALPNKPAWIREHFTFCPVWKICPDCMKKLMEG